MKNLIIENRNGKWFVNYKEFKDLNQAEKKLLGAFFKALKQDYEDNK